MFRNIIIKQLTFHKHPFTFINIVKMSTQNLPKVHFYRRVLPSVCTSFCSDEGKTIFKEALVSGHMDCYFGLASQFRTQDEPAYCGLSTLVMVLNTLEVDPRKIWKGPWRWYHENMLDCCVSLKEIEKSGIIMEQFACLASCNTLNTKMIRADSTKQEDEFRKIVQEYSKSSKKVLVASYSRPTLQQTGSGHFSPIGGYHPEKDLVLIMDTARFKYPPHWVPLSLLWEAMSVLDGDTGKPRGYFLLSKSSTEPLILFQISVDLAVTVPIDKGYGDGMLRFLTKWQNWLSQKSEGDEESIIKDAIDHLLDALTELETESIMNTQVDIDCPELIESTHSCAVKELIENLGQLDIFHLVKEGVENNESTAAKISVPQTEYCQSKCKNKSTSHCVLSIKLTPAHFISMLLLSWPYKTCGNDNGHNIKKRIIIDIANSSKILQNEVSQLRLQFHSVLGYLNTCEKCCCQV